VGIYYPVGAVDFLPKSRLSGNFLNEFNWGEYLIWVLQPSCKVAMDGRYETVYDDNLCQLRAEFFYGRPGWREFLEKYLPDLTLVDRAGWGKEGSERQEGSAIPAPPSNSLYLRVPEDKTGFSLWVKTGRRQHPCKPHASPGRSLRRG
jgi:hypothetical protein